MHILQNDDIIGCHDHQNSDSKLIRHNAFDGSVIFLKNFRTDYIYKTSIFGDRIFAGGNLGNFPRWLIFNDTEEFVKCYANKTS